MDDDQGIVSYEDAAAIGFRVVEMADRAKIGVAFLPGAETKWEFSIDGTRFECIVRKMLAD